ncbi:MAG: GNAT family N-acetyltransferase [Candidatus Eisenbacteria bacterium]|nr:GNAT family N-acetyltransferase [Candidatus Eisenbacteria bacterium]
MDICRLTSDETLKQLLELSEDFFAEYEGFHEGFFRVAKLDREAIESYFRGFMGTPDHVVYVAIDGEAPIGYITARIQDQDTHWAVRRVGHISGLMVSRDRRRQGVGRELLHAARRFFGENGVQYFTVYTAVGNRSASEFYRACGLTPLHTNWLGEV